MPQYTKFFRKVVLTILCFSLFTSNTSASSFSDLLDNNRYSTAIEYLTEVGIINGYPDGTFKPDQNVNRVEFLKLVLESSEITTDIDTPTIFPDIDNTAWYAKYVRKAFNEGWIEGYPDGTFKPEQNINKVEALKIIGQVQKWATPEEITEQPFNDIQIDEWYTPYISYAQSKNYLEETGNNYIPETIQSRARISELLFRSFITSKSESEEYSSSLVRKYPASLYVIEKTGSETENTTTVNNDFTSVDYQTFDKDFFDDITLNSPFPNIFYQNEVYYLEGTINNGTYEQAFVFLAPEGETNDENYLNYSAEVSSNKFSIPIIFRETGNYSMGLILGVEGESKILDISVLQELPSTTNPDTIGSTITNTDITYTSQKTTVSWDNKDNDLTKLTISQGTKSKTFYFRQNREKFNIDYQDFKDFSIGTTEYSLNGAQLATTYPLEIKTDWSNTTSSSFTASEHHYSAIEHNLISYDSFPEIQDNLATIEITGTTHTDIYTEVAITTPNGFVEIQELTSPDPFETFYNSNIIPSGNDFTFTYRPNENGIYTIEINLTDGSAVFNTPVYVDIGIPLIPNYFDLNPYVAPEANFNLSEAQQEMLAFINEARIAAALSPVVLDEDLNTLAQLHSEDMKERQFFNHVNPDGKTPNDRRVEQGIVTAVGENLAISPTVEYTHVGLMQSGIHRKNILDDKWTRVGIGIVQDTDGSLLTTEEFSYDPLSEIDLQTVKDEMLSAANEERSDAELAPFTVSTALEDAAESWSTIMAEEDFFDFIAPAPSTNTLQNEIDEHVPGKTVQALILESVNIDKLEEELVKNSEIVDSYWEKIGFGLQLDNIGTLKATVLFSTD